MFREANLPNGQKGPVSARRVLAAYFAALTPFLFTVAILEAPATWYAYIPGAICVLASLLLLFFTTWTDVAAVVSAAKGAK